jgi:translation initiation factor IF-2
VARQASQRPHRAKPPPHQQRRNRRRHRQRGLHQLRRRLRHARQPAGGAGAAAEARAPAGRDETGKPGEARRTPDGQIPKRRPIADETPDDDDRKKKGGNLKGPARAPVKVADERRERGKLTVDKLLNDEQRERSLASLRRKRERDARRASGIQISREKISREVILPETISIQELANRMAERGVDVIKLLMKQGQMLKITDVIDADTAQLLAEELGHTVKRVSESDVEEGLFSEVAERTDGPVRPRS